MRWMSLALVCALVSDAAADDKLPAVAAKATESPPAKSLAWYLVIGQIKLAADPQVAVLGPSEGEVALGDPKIE